MPLSTFERFVPWTGAIAGLAWIGQAFLFRTDTEDYPGKASTAVIRDHLGQNYAAVGCLVIMGIALVFFASALRSQLRSGEAREATYSSVAYGGVLLASAGLSQMVMWNWGLINGAADAKDDAALHVLSFVGYFGFAGMGIGLATMFIATGLAGVRNRVLPRWFAIVTVVMGILSALGAAGIPPGGLVNYLLLPFWLIGTAVILARRQHSAGARQRPLTTPAL
jgi:type IV secretory pathway VirB2 component (pilin)